MSRVMAGASAALDERETPDVETSSADYARRFAGPVGGWFLRVQEQAVLPLLTPWAGGSVLEVGGGHGQLTGALVRQGFRVTVLGSDMRCRERVMPWVAAGQASFAAGNLLALPFPDRQFDVVVSVRLLPHVAAWPVLVRELSRVARHAVIVDYPAAQSLNRLTPALFSAKRRLEGNTRPYRLFRDAELADAFAETGFARRARRAQFFWPMVLHRLGRNPLLSSGLEWPARLTGLTAGFGSPVIALFARAR
jgi:2-polyprenyl-3-methyl-5-hydroxy-6-metoxy-1,4-benzoquinol methylase